MGLGQKGVTYTMTASTIATLLDSNNNDLTLCFDTIFISGNVVINRSNITKNQYLTLMTNDYQTGAIVFLEGATLTVTAANKFKSYVTLSSLNINGLPQITATQAKLSNNGKKYERIEMNGFKNWNQWEIDTLLAHADKVGPDIGNGAYDFTSNTRFTIDSNKVFSMKALTSFQGKKMGFKNMDRGGTLLPGTQELGAYPDSFYVDLSKADGIRFKVELQGSASSFNIGLSNCLKENGWHVHCFEYFVYNIPFDAVDKDGYVTLPFSMFERVSWGTEWDLSQFIVFIMEVSNAANNTVVSFSDVHGYKLSTENHPNLYVGNIKVNGELSLSVSNGIIRQKPNTCIEATTASITCDKYVILDNEENLMSGTVNISAPYAFIKFHSNTTSSKKYNFNASSLLRYDLNNVWGDDVSQGVKYNYTMTIKDTMTHTYEICYNSSYMTLNTDHYKDFCENEKTKLAAGGNAKSEQYKWFDEQMQIIGRADTLDIQALTSGKHRYYVILDTTIMGKKYQVTKSSTLEIHPTYSLFDTVEICESELPYKWNDTLFGVGTSSNTFTFKRQSIYGCDSITQLYLTVNPTYTKELTDSICAGTEYSKNGFKISTLVSDGGKTILDTLTLKTVSGCDSTCYLKLYLYPQVVTEINDTVKKGESYTKYGFDISDTEIGTEDFQNVLTSAVGCDSIVILHLTTIINDGISDYRMDSEFSLYPNPAIESVFFKQEADGQAASLHLTDLFGRNIRKIQVNGNISEISLQDLAAGCYYLNIFNSSDKLIGVLKVYKK